MKFTDEDLKLLKKSLEGQSGAEGFYALIARLEQSETERDTLAHALGRFARYITELTKRLEEAGK